MAQAMSRRNLTAQVRSEITKDIEEDFNAQLEGITEGIIDMCEKYAHIALLDYNEWLGIRHSSEVRVEQYLREKR